MLGTYKAGLSLLRWLGPWVDEHESPPHVVRVERRLSERVRVWIYERRGRKPEGAMLVCPGMHYAGPADPRFDRFNRILANAGFLVYSPFLADFTNLVMARSVIDDLDLALGAMLERAERPGIFSVSFGSLPTLTVAAMAHRRDHLGGLMIFGGYADFFETIRHCMCGEGRDPLNLPVVFMNLMPWLELGPDDPRPLLAAWKKYIRTVWGRPELKHRERFQPIAEAIEPEVPERDRLLYRIGIGLEGDPEAICAPILKREAPPWVDPRNVMHDLRCPVHLVHGVDDDVIPPSQLDLLARAVPSGVPVETYLTGLYGHTGQAGISALSQAAKEGLTLLSMLRAMAGIALR